MRLSVVLIAAAIAFATPAAAQQAPSEHQLALADRYLSLAMGSGYARVLEEQLKEEFGKSELSAEERTWLTSNLSAALQRAMTRTVADIRDDVATLFTETELEAMIAFQNSPVGRSTVDKNIRLGIILQQAMQAPLMEAMRQTMEKYCTTFTCAAGDNDAALKQ